MSAPDFHERLNDFLGVQGVGFLNSLHGEDDILHFMEVCRITAWDIPSVLGSICDHFNKEFPMHRDTTEYKLTGYFEEWENIDKHFLEVHKVDLTNERINWSFDT